MIHWLWLFVAVSIGAIAGFFAAALMGVGREEDEHRKWWDDG